MQRGFGQLCWLVVGVDEDPREVQGGPKSGSRGVEAPWSLQSGSGLGRLRGGFILLSVGVKAEQSSVLGPPWGRAAVYNIPRTKPRVSEFTKV